MGIYYNFNFLENFKNVEFRYPDEMKAIVDYLSERGTIHCSPERLEELYEEYSDEMYDASWIECSPSELPKFAEWLNEKD